MPVRIVEGQLPYTGGTGIEIDANKVISLLLREENNLIMVNDDNEVYTDLQLASGLTPSSTFPVGVTVGKVLQADGRPQNGLILNWKTTSGDYARWIYANDGKLYFDKGDGTRNQVYYASEVDALFTALRAEIDELYMKWSDFHWISSSAVNLTLSLSVDYTPTDDFIVNAPTTIEEGQTYILRVNNGNTVYTMVLGDGINNIQGANTSLTQNATDMFVFLAVNGELELQRDINPNGPGIPNDGQLTLQKNGTQIGVFTANQATNTTVNIEVPTVVDDLTTQSTTNALSANQGSVLKGMIDDLAGFGKFLSLWNATTGQPISFPLATPYTYSTGDYFVVEVVSSATPPVNYRPNGSSYNNVASSTPETDELEVGDVYVYDGSVWLLQSNHGKTVAFSNIAGDPYDNTNLANALGDKQDTLIAGTNITIAADGKTISADNTTYSSATTTTAGIVKLGNDTVFTDSIASPGTTTGKTYPVQLNASGQMAVNVPRVNTTYGAGTGINIDGNNDIQNTGVTSVNGNTGAVTVTDTTYTAGEGIEIKNGLDYSAMQGPAPTGYHVPSKNERVALCSILTSTFSMASNATTMGTYLKMPMAGYRAYSSSDVSSQGTVGFYCSSTASSDEGEAYNLYFSSANLNPQYAEFRSVGCSVRCFKDTPVIPDSTWTTLFDGSGIAADAGIFHNTADGLISISSDGQNRITIQDKNLGATTVYNDGDLLSQANCGNYYQRGNNYGFPFTGTVTTSNTLVDASNYGPGNYYSSSTFIIYSYSGDWSSVQNDNLRGGETGVVTLNNSITNTGVLSVNGNTGAVTVNEVPSGGNNGDVLTNVSGTPTWAAATGIQNDTTGTTTTVSAIRAGTEAEYNSLGSHSASVIYHIY